MNRIDMDIETVLPIIKRTSLFRHLPLEDLQRLLSNFEQVEYAPNEVILTEGSISDELYIVLEGAVSVEVDQSDERVYICTLGPGEMFGEAGIFMNVARTANVVARDGAGLIRIGRTRFLREIKSHPGSGVKILFMMVYTLLRKLKEVNHELAYERRDDGCQDEVDALIGSLLPETKNPDTAEEIFSRT